MTTTTMRRLAAVAAAGALILSGCGSDADEPETTPAPVQSPVDQPAPETSPEPEPTPEPEETQPAVAEGEPTPPGTRLSVGDSAIVRYSTGWEDGEAEEEQLIEISIREIEEASIADIPSPWELGDGIDPSDVTVLYVWHTVQQVGPTTHDIAFYNTSSGYESTDSLRTQLIRSSTDENCTDETPANNGFADGELVDSCFVLVVFEGADYVIKWNQFQSPYQDPYGEDGTNSIIWDIA